MSYQLLLSPKADCQFGNVPDEFVDVVEENLRRLADSPTTHSKPIASSDLLSTRTL